MILVATEHLVQFSGGVGSWAAARRVRDRYMKEGDTLTLLFADTKMEDEDLYRFIEEAAADVEGNLIKISDGRDVWEVFFDTGYLGNSRIDPCSKLLKRTLLRKWIQDNCKASDTVIYLGIDWSEIHRLEKAEPFWGGWALKAPLTEKPYLEKEDFIQQLMDRGIDPPRLYAMGFPHNNCGGFCVKAGQAQFALLLEQFPERYAYHENKEQEIREYLGKDVSILVDRRGGTKKTLTLKSLRERIESGEKIRGSFGGCGCALDG